MESLLYREDWQDARERLTRWWHGEELGRPMMLIIVPRDEPHEHIEVLPEPQGWTSFYSTRSMAYRVNLARRACVGSDYFAEACPYYLSGDIAPGCLAAFLGSTVVEQEGTVWLRPCIANPEETHIEYQPDNFYWKFSLEVYRQVLAHSKERFLNQFPDCEEGLDILAALRGNQALLMDMIDRPRWVRSSLKQITDLYFRYYDVLYDLVRDDIGGCVYWLWAPGRMAKLQCDFSAMIGPEMFEDFMLPVLEEMTERLSYTMYHWDGPGALPHHDALLSLERLGILQWTPGAGVEPDWHRRWWPLYHKTLDAGKKLWINVESKYKEDLLRLKQEFGQRTQRMLINLLGASSPNQAQEFIKMMEL